MVLTKKSRHGCQCTGAKDTHMWVTGHTHMHTSVWFAVGVTRPGETSHLGAAELGLVAAGGYEL